MKIFAFTGFIGAGKTTAAHMVVDYFGRRGKSVFKTCFAHYLKDLAWRHLGLSKELQKVGYGGDMLKNSKLLVKELLDNSTGTKVAVDTYTLEDKIIELAEAATECNVRKVMQLIGTDIARKCIDQNYWCSYIMKILDNVREYTDVAVIDDCRFMDEGKILRADNARIIYINTPNFITAERLNISESEYLEKLDHPSEHDAPNIPNHYAFNNEGSMGDLRRDIYATCGAIWV